MLAPGKALIARTAGYVPLRSRMCPRRSLASLARPARSSASAVVRPARLGASLRRAAPSCAPDFRAFVLAERAEGPQRRACRAARAALPGARPGPGRPSQHRLPDAACGPSPAGAVPTSHVAILARTRAHAVTFNERHGAGLRLFKSWGDRR